MALIERDLFGQKHDKVETAIKRFKTFEPAEGYYLADSGGKDSTVVRALPVMENPNMFFLRKNLVFGFSFLILRSER
jgi:hypothetical protein